MSLDKKDILSQLQEKFTLTVDTERTTDTLVYLRSTISSSEDAAKFVKEYCKAENSNFNVFSALANPIQCLFQKRWKCRYSSRYLKKHYECNAMISIKIKKINRSTKTRDSFLKLKPPLPCVITIFPHHTHDVHAPELLRMLRISDEIREKFIQFFNDGLGVSGARVLNSAQLLIGNPPEILGNSSLNPPYHRVFCIYRGWKKKHLKDIDHVKKMIDKIPFFETCGTTVKVCQSKPWAVIVTTSVMKRAQTHAHIREMIFIDSITKAHYSVTVLLTATKIGVIPICVLLHENETYECYCNAFELFKNTCPLFFEETEKGYTVFLTRNSDSMRSAFRETWHSAHLLLCQFHVAVNEWKWMQLSDNNVPKEDRRHLMTLFLDILYAKTKKDLEDASDRIFEYDNSTTFSNHFKQFFDEHQKEWITFHRHNSGVQNSDTNNYAETTIRVLRHTIVEVSKKFNIVGLAEFCSSVLNQFLIQRLQVYENDNQITPVLFYDMLENKVFENLTVYKQTEEKTFLVFKQVPEIESLTVDSSEGNCSCFVGKDGGFCEHQYYVYKFYSRTSPNLPSLSSPERYVLVKMALGNKCPHVNSFL